MRQLPRACLAYGAPRWRPVLAWPALRCLAHPPARLPACLLTLCSVVSTWPRGWTLAHTACESSTTHGGATPSAWRRWQRQVQRARVPRGWRGWGLRCWAEASSAPSALRRRLPPEACAGTVSKAVQLPAWGRLQQASRQACSRQGWLGVWSVRQRPPRPGQQTRVPSSLRPAPTPCCTPRPGFQSTSTHMELPPGSGRPGSKKDTRWGASPSCRAGPRGLAGAAVGRAGGGAAGRALREHEVGGPGHRAGRWAARPPRRHAPLLPPHAGRGQAARLPLGWPAHWPRPDWGSSADPQARLPVGLPPRLQRGALRGSGQPPALPAHLPPTHLPPSPVIL